MGSDPQTTVLYDAFTLGTAFIGLVSTNSGFPVYQGRFEAILVPGASPFNGQNVGATISQAGTIPGDAQSLFFLSSPISDAGLDLLGVFLNDQRLSVLPGLTPGSYSADVSGFAGQDVTLKFTAFDLAPVRSSSVVVDSIAFSTVPEPSTWAIFGVGGLLAWAFVRRKALRR